MTRGSQKLKQEKHMLCLSKLDSLIWQTGTSDFASKTETFDFSRQYIRERKTFTTFQASTSIHFGINKITNI
jgi:hypothetical protein